MKDILSQEEINSLLANSKEDDSYDEMFKIPFADYVNVSARQVEFEEFDKTSENSVPSDISELKELPLKISVELGKTTKTIGEILKLSLGSVIELDNMFGESINIFANDKLIAKGEIIVIDENYGIRITEIIN